MKLLLACLWLAPVTVLAVALHQEWRNRCQECLTGMSHSKSDAEFDHWDAAMRTNMRRYEQEC